MKNMLLELPLRLEATKYARATTGLNISAPV